MDNEETPNYVHTFSLHQGMLSGDSEVRLIPLLLMPVMSSNSSDDSDYKQTCKCSSFSSETLKNAS